MAKKTRRTKTITIPARTAAVTFPEYVGQRIRDRRLKLKMTQDFVVEQADISKTFLSEVENGKRGIGLYKLYELSIVLGCSLDWFVRGWDVRGEGKRRG